MSSRPQEVIEATLGRVRTFGSVILDIGALSVLERLALLDAEDRNKILNEMTAAELEDPEMVMRPADLDTYHELYFPLFAARPVRLRGPPRPRPDCPRMPPPPLLAHPLSTHDRR